MWVGLRQVIADDTGVEAYMQLNPVSRFTRSYLGLRLLTLFAAYVVRLPFVTGLLYRRLPVCDDWENTVV